MAVPANTFITQTAVGQAEDVQSIIYRVDATQTPIVELCGETEATGIMHEWQTEVIDSVNLNNSALEGDDYANEAANNPARIGSYSQIMRRVFQVSGTLEAVKKHGRASEERRQMVLKGLALRRDKEGIISQNQGQRAEAGANTRLTRSIESWMSTNVSRGVGGANAANATSAPTDGTLRNLTETIFKASLAAHWNVGGEPDKCTVFAGGTQKQTISTFAGRTGAFTDVSQDTILAAASRYASDFGTVKIMPSRNHRSRTILGLNPDYIKIAYLRRLFKDKVAKTGDAQRYAMVDESCLEMSNERAHFLIADLN